MRILLSDTWAGGGASTFVATLGRGLSAAGHTVDVIVGYRDSPAVRDYAAEVNRVFRPPADFNEVVLGGDYDIIHVTEDDLAPPFDYNRRVRRLGLRAQVVVTLHAEHSRVDPLAADAVVYVSETAARAADRDPCTHLVISNGVDASWLLATADPSLLGQAQIPVAVWVGRCHDPMQQKGFPEFLAAIRPLLDRGWRVVVLDGAPDPDGQVAQSLRSLFGGEVVYGNQVPRAQVLGCLAEAGRSGGAFISTSRTEAAPFIALEALAVGCPVVAPPIAGYSALVASAHATTYDDIDDLIDVLERRTHALAKRGLPDPYSASEMIERYLAVYGRLARSQDARSLRSRTSRTAVRVLISLKARRFRSLTVGHRSQT